MPEDVSGTTMKLTSVLSQHLCGFCGFCTQGRGSLCREPRFQFAINLNTRHLPQASVRLEASQKGAVQRRCIC